MYRYHVQCWTRPRSGFDLALKSKVMSLLKELLSENVFDEKITESMDEFEKEHEGLVLRTLVIDTDEIVYDIEKQLMPKIRQQYPGAILDKTAELINKETE